MGCKVCAYVGVSVFFKCFVYVCVCFECYFVLMVLKSGWEVEFFNIIIITICSHYQFRISAFGL